MQFLCSNRMGEAPLAYIVKNDESNICSNDVADFVAARAAPYKRLAGGVVFIDQIPRTASGKILRKDLKKLHGFCAV